MDERMIQFRIGVMVLATVVIAAILLVVFGEGPELFRPTYRVTIRAPEAAGVTIGTPVRRRGILIGRISDVRFDEAGREVVLTARIYSQFTIRQNEQCVITAGLLGEPEVDFGPPAEGPLAEATVPPGASLTATVRRGPVEVITNLEQRLATAADSVRTTSKRVEAAAEQITNLLKVNEETITSMLQKADRNMEILGQAVGNLNELIADEEVRQRIREGLAQLPDLVQQASDTLKSVDTTFAELNQQMPRLRRFVDALEEQGPEIVQDVAQAAEHAKGVTRRLEEELEVLGQALRSEQGSLGQLLHNPDLYQNLNRAAMNIEELTRQLRPIASDLRVFSDKIARHPELLGVRGALQRNPGVKGLPHLYPSDQASRWAAPPRRR